MINPQTPEPLFEQIAGMLRRDISSGRIQPGQLLPSETRLHQQYGVSRLTARAAVNVIRAEGLAEHVNGRGVVVREPSELEDLILPAGSSVTGRMPTTDERRAYEIPEGVPVFSVTAADGSVEVYPADRWRLRPSASSDSPNP